MRIPDHILPPPTSRLPAGRKACAFDQNDAPSLSRQPAIKLEVLVAYDANGSIIGNVAALVDSDGTIQEGCTYTVYGEATILLFFVLPVKARWFLWLEILFAFVFGLLPYKDLPGFLGVCTAVFLTYSSLVPGGPRRVLHNWRKRLEAQIIEQRLQRMRRKRKFDVIDGDKVFEFLG